MNCPNCDEIMEREDSLAGRREFYKPEALYQCENCGLQGRWALREKFQITYDPRDEFNPTIFCGDGCECAGAEACG